TPRKKSRGFRCRSLQFHAGSPRKLPRRRPRTRLLSRNPQYRLQPLRRHRQRQFRRRPARACAVEQPPLLAETQIAPSGCRLPQAPARLTSEFRVATELFHATLRNYTQEEPRRLPIYAKGNKKSAVALRSRTGNDHTGYGCAEGPLLAHQGR